MFSPRITDNKNMNNTIKCTADSTFLNIDDSI